MSTYYFLPTRNVFGEGSVQEAGTLAKTLNVKKILIVTDAFLAKNGMADKVAKIYQEAGIDVHIFGGAEPNPTHKTSLLASNATANMAVTGLSHSAAVRLMTVQKGLVWSRQMAAIFAITKGSINPAMI